MKTVIVLFLMCVCAQAWAQEFTDSDDGLDYQNQYVQLVLSVEAQIATTHKESDMTQCVTNDVLAPLPPTGTCTLVLDGKSIEVRVVKNAIGAGVAFESADGVVRSLFATWNGADEVTAIIRQLDVPDRVDVEAVTEVISLLRAATSANASVAQTEADELTKR